MVVVPAETPVTVPELSTVATDALLLVYDKAPDVASLSIVWAPPAHTVVVPSIAEGLAYTVFGYVV